MTSTDEDGSGPYTTAVGACLRAARKQRGLSLLAVESASEREFKASVLGAYERGERVISVLRLQRLAEIYEVPVDRLLPRPETRTDDPHRRAELPSTNLQPNLGAISIDLSELSQTTGSEAQLIRFYLRGIQSRRRSSDASLITIRKEDLLSLGRALQLNHTAMVRRLYELGVCKQ